MKLNDEIKAEIVRRGWSLRKVVEALNEKYSRNDTVQNLSQKLTRGTIRYSEVKEIAEIINCEIIWRDIKG